VLSNIRLYEEEKAEGNDGAAENIESLLKIGKQSLVSLMQRGSTFHQPRQMERTTQIDYSVIIVTFFRLKAG